MTEYTSRSGVADSAETPAKEDTESAPETTAPGTPTPPQRNPDIRAAYEANRDAGLVVVAVDIQESPDTIREYAQRYGLTYLLGVDTMPQS